jgi:hypothetical protein
MLTFFFRHDRSRLALERERFRLTKVKYLKLRSYVTSGVVKQKNKYYP